MALKQAQPRAARKPQIIASFGGQGQRQVTNAADVTEYAAKFDVLSHISGTTLNFLSDLLTANPNFVFLRYRYPHATQNSTQYDGASYKAIYNGEWYVKDVDTAEKVQSTNAWWHLDLRQSAIRGKIIAEMVVEQAGQMHGYFCDISFPWAYNGAFSTEDRLKASGGLADCGNLDGGWDPANYSTSAAARTARPTFTDGTFQTTYLTFLQSLVADNADKWVIINHYGSRTIEQHPSTGTYWRGQIDNYMSAVSGGMREGCFLNNGAAMSESDWAYQIGRAEEVIGAGRVAMIYPTGNLYDTVLRTFAFCSYMLVADGQYAWYTVKPAASQWDTVYDTNFGTAQGAYRVVDGVYIRDFELKKVYVNPGASSRTAEGQTLPGKTGLIIAASPSLPAIPANLRSNGPTTTTTIPTQWDNVATETSFEIHFKKSTDGAYPAAQITGIAADTLTYTVGGGGEGPLVSDTPYDIQVQARNATGPSGWSNTYSVGTQPAAPTYPAAPSGATITFIDWRTMTFGCTDNSSDESGFYWRILKTPPGGQQEGPVLVGTTGANTTTLVYTDPSPGEGQNEYILRVNSFNASGESVTYAESAPATSAAKPSSPPPANPSGPVYPSLESLVYPRDEDLKYPL